ncbi:MAG: hemolysin family protein [Nocardioides sp.]|nr:hemolysin family protein [Nocardioides sp.]
MDSQTFLNVGLVVLFVLVGGVFAATELALVSLRDSQLTALERRGPRGVRVAEVARDPNRFLAAVQIGVTVAGFLSAAYGGSTLAPDVAPYLERLGMAEAAADTTALVVLTLAIAYLSLVFGELVPKRLALQKAEGVSLAVAPVLDRFAVLMRPVIWLLSVSTNAVVRLLGGDPHATSEQLSEEELRELVSTHDDLDEQERAILRDVFAATEKTLKEVMRPRRDVVFMAGTMRLSEAAAQVRELPHSRYPVTGRDFDDVIGFLHVRDLLGRENDNSRVRDVCRPVPMLPGTRHVLPSVALMREEGTHLAVVVDEYGGTDGIVTLEDLVEELVGDIRDEYDAPEPIASHATLDAGLSIEDFTEATGLPLADGEYETVAGYVIARLGRIPDVGDTVDVEGATIEVSAIEGHRVRAVTLHPRNADGEDASEDGAAPRPGQGWSGAPDPTP